MFYHITEILREHSFHTRKLGEIAVFCAVLKLENHDSLNFKGAVLVVRDLRSETKGSRFESGC